MKMFSQNAAMFTIGASGYVICEILYRGHTHWTMGLTGGVCTLLIHLLNRRRRAMPLLVKLLAGGGIITATEFVVGIIVNRMLGWGVWDYSAVRGNILGQICPQFTLCWIALTLPVLGISRMFLKEQRRGIIRFGEGR